jgi:predicted flap endonuclease-1-like 5' DNA nuclease
MTNIAHLTETAFLLLAAYLAGCVLGYAARRILHAARGTRQVAAVAAPVAAPAPPRRSPSAAARLAARVDEPLEQLAPRPGRPVAATTNPPSKPAAAQAKLPGQRPPSLAAPRDGLADNLMQIKGIGPKIEASLHGLGIFHIDQIAGWTRAHADWVDARLGYGGRIRRERWVEQAIALARTKAVA